MIKKILSKIIGFFIVLGLVSTVVVIYAIFHFSRKLPDYSQLAKYYPPLVTRIYSADGKLIEEYAKEYRVFAPLEYMPRSLIEAFLAAEDKNFYEHEGIDYLGVVRAALVNLNNIISNKRLEGASTITQQVVKNFILTSERSFERKIKEAVLSYMISKKFTKDQILELYLNQIFLGRRSYGVAAASINYFGKSVEELTLEEAAFLAGLPKAPSAFSPTRNYQRAKARRDYVIKRMYEEGYISDDAAREAIKKPISLKNRDKSMMINAGHFADRVKNIVTSQIGDEIFYSAGLNIFTTLDSKTQQEAEKALNNGIIRFEESKGFRSKITSIKIDDWKNNLNELKLPVNIKDNEMAVILSTSKDHAVIGLKNGKFGKITLEGVKWARTSVKSVSDLLQVGNVVAVKKSEKTYFLRPIPEVNGAIMVMEPNSSRVLAYVGGYDYSSSKFDRVSQAQRQPGSAVKPFVYLAALENDIAPNTIYYDGGPLSLSQGPGLKPWCPKNYKGDFLGDITLRKALEKSRNIVTARIAEQLGIQSIIEILQRFGINDNPNPYYSMVLGALETTLEKMTTAFSMVASGGFRKMPHYIEFIQDRNGKVIYRKDDDYCGNCEVEDFSKDIEYPLVKITPSSRVTDVESNYQLISILEGAVRRGTSAAISSVGANIAGKTGTTNKSFDTWFFAFTPNLVAGCYIGYDSPKTLGSRATGSSVALPVIRSLFTDYYKGKKIPSFQYPKSLIKVKIDKNTGVPVSDYDGIIEYFKPKGDNSIENFYPKRNFIRKSDEEGEGEDFFYDRKFEDFEDVY